MRPTNAVITALIPHHWRSKSNRCVTHTHAHLRMHKRTNNNDAIAQHCTQCVSVLVCRLNGSAVRMGAIVNDYTIVHNSNSAITNRLNHQRHETGSNQLAAVCTVCMSHVSICCEYRYTAFRQNDTTTPAPKKMGARASATFTTSIKRVCAFVHIDMDA